VFVDPELQNLYDELIQTGSQSLGDALKVGAVIEEIDILDLEENLDFAENENIRNVFINLIRGSENHLRAFTKTLARNTGETYQPQFMDIDAYNEIVSTTSAIPQRLNQQVDQMTNNRGGRNRR
jgi:rubrerythrin